MTGLIIKAVSGEFTVYDIDTKEYIKCKPRGNISYNGESLTIGDYVSYDENYKIITSVNQRKNTLVRPLISNVDKMIIATSIKEPNLNLYLLDKMIAIYEYYDITPVLLFTKTDLIDDLKELDEIKEYYSNIGYHVYYSSINNYDKTIENEFDNNIICVSGNSGVGKSTFINNLIPELNLKTDEISLSLGRGKHTTRHSELYKYHNGWICDSPGFGNIEFMKMDSSIVSDLFIEFQGSRQECKYNNCTHTNEPNCKIKEMVNNGIIRKSRYENYLRFLEEVKKINNKF